MLGLIQRVSQAEVVVDGEVVGKIGQGLLLLLGIQKPDNQECADKLLNKVLDYRVFNDDQGKMNLSLRNINGELLIVSQFTLAADTQKGLRPSFSAAAKPQDANALYDYFVSQAMSLHPDKTATGRFGADMKVSLLNDGPVTFMLQVDA